MHAKDIIRGGFHRAKMVTELLLDDFTDAELLERPVAGANHVAWQLGHLIVSIQHFGEAIEPHSMPALPAGFAAQHSSETSNLDDAAAFLSKSAYLRLLAAQREALLQVLDELPEARLGEEAPEQFRSYAPKIGDVLELAAAHELMHSGQLTVLRRKLGKPVAF